MQETSNLTDKQKLFCKTVKELTEKKGYPPTRAEIRDAMGYRSVNTVCGFINVLEKKGVVQREFGKSRTIKVIDADELPKAVQK